MPWRKRLDQHNGNGRNLLASIAPQDKHGMVMDAEQRNYIIKSLAIRRRENEQFRSVAILLDGSRSMAPYIAEVQSGTSGVVGTLLDEDEVVILSFSESTRMILPINVMEEHRGQTASALLTIEPHGQTALWDGIGDSVDILESDATYTSRIVIVLTDGEDNRSRKFRSANEVIDYAKNRTYPVKVIIIGVGKGIDSKSLREVALGTNGSFIQVEQSKQGIMLGLEEASTALALIDMSDKAS